MKVRPVLGALIGVAALAFGVVWLTRSPAPSSVPMPVATSMAAGAASVPVPVVAPVASPEPKPVAAEKGGAALPASTTRGAASQRVPESVAQAARPVLDAPVAPVVPSVERPPEKVQAVESPASEKVPPTVSPVATTPIVARVEPAVRWPRSGEVRYAVLYGDNGIQLGTSVHRWEIRADGRYRMTATTEPTGIAALSFLKVDSIHWLSEGRMTVGGFAPERFVERKGSQVLNVRFNSAPGRVYVNDHEEAQPPGMQDVMTLFYQLGHPAGGPGPGGLVSVTSGYRVEQYHLERAGEQVIDLPVGDGWRTRLLRARNGEETAEIWLAADRFGLPVQIRKTDKGGQKFTLKAVEVKVTEDALDNTTH